MVLEEIYLIIQPSTLKLQVFQYFVRFILMGGTADYVHVDSLDCEFVPNSSLGIPVVKAFGQAVFSFKKFKATID